MPSRRTTKLAIACEHTDRLVKARGLCARCYDRWLINTNPKVRESKRAKARRKYWRERDRYLAYQKKRRMDGKDCSPAEKRNRHLKKKYGITLYEYTALLFAQDFKCLICKAECPENHNFPVDHCHRTKRVRGILCDRCNLDLGYVEKFLLNPEWTRAAITYLGGADILTDESAA